MRTLIVIATAALLALVGCGSAQEAGVDSSAGAESSADAGAVAQDGAPQKWSAALIGNTDCNDGAKGVIVNYTKAPITVAGKGTSPASVDLPPNEGAVFYDCTYQAWRDMDVPPPARRGVVLSISATGSSATPATFSVVDDIMLRPFTRFAAGGVDNFRTNWAEGESHHELSPGTDLWVKRESDDWDGGHENSKTSDWPVFTIHVDKAS